MTRREGDRSRALLWVAALAVTAGVVLAHFYLTPTSPFLDEGDHASTGRLLASGGVMYRDAFNEKGPGLYWITAGLFTTFGDRFSVVRHAATVGMVATLLLIFALGAKYGRPRAAVFAALVFALYHLMFLGKLWQAESVLTPLTLAIVYLLSTDREGRTPTAAAFFSVGLALFIATAMKQTAWLLVFAVLAWMVWEKSFSGRRLGAFAAGLLAPWAAVLLAVAAQGTLGDIIGGYLFPIRGFLSVRYTESPSRAEFFIELPVWFMALAYLFRWRTERPGGSLANGRLIVAVLAGTILMLTQTIFAHYVLPVLAGDLPSMRANVAIFAHHFLPVLAMAATAFSLLVIGPAGAPARAVRSVLLGTFVGLSLLAAVYAPTQYRDRVGVFEATSWFDIAREIAATTKPDDPIFAFPHDSSYYYFAHRQPPGRYGFLLPWTSPDGVIDRTLAEFDAHPPAAILYTYLANGTPKRFHPRDYLARVLTRIERDYYVDRVYENDVVLLRPYSPERPATPASVESVNRLFSLSRDFCWRPAEVIRREIGLDKPAAAPKL